MTYVAFPQAGSSQVDKSQFAANPVTPTVVGDISSFETGLQSLPEVGMYSWAMKSYLRNTQTGNYLSGDQVKSQYPELASEYPKGGAQSDLNYDQQRRTMQDNEDQYMGNMAPGVIQTVSRYGANLVGSSLSPVMAGGGEVLGKAATWVGEPIVRSIVASDLAEKTAQRLAAASKAVIGGAQGMGTIAPLVASTKDYYHSINETYSPWNTAIMLGLGGFGGAAARTVLGFKTPIQMMDEDMISQKAVSDLAAGKNVNIDPLVKQGLYRARQLDPDNNIDPESQTNILKGLGDMRDKAVTEAAQSKKDYNDYLDENPHTIPTQSDIPLTGEQITDKATELRSVPEEMYSPENKTIMDSLPQNLETKQAMTYASKDPSTLTADESNFLNQFKGGNEAKWVNDGVDEANKHLDNVKKALKEVDREAQPEAGHELDLQKEIIENELNAKKERLMQLRQLEKEPVALRKLRKGSMKAQSKVDSYNKMIENTDNYFRLGERGNDPITKEDIQTTQAYDRSPKSNLTYEDNPAKIDEMLNKPESVSDEEVNAMKDEVKTYADNNEKGNEDLKSAIKELDKRDKVNKKINQKLQEYIDCNKGI